MQISRTQFLEICLGAVATTVGLSAIAACGGGDGDGDGSETGGSPNDTGGTGGGSGGTSNAGTGGSATGGSATGGAMAGGAVSSCSADVEEVLAHVHELTVPAADANAGTAKTYTLSNVGHVHDVMVTAAMFEQLAAGGTVMVESTVTEQHSHTISITCA